MARCVRDGAAAGAAADAGAVAAAGAPERSEAAGSCCRRTAGAETFDGAGVEGRETDGRLGEGATETGGSFGTAGRLGVVTGGRLATVTVSDGTGAIGGAVTCTGGNVTCPVGKVTLTGASA